MDGSESDACYFMFPGPWLTSRARKGSRESIQMAEGLQPRGWSDKEHEGDTPTPLHPKIKKKSSSTWSEKSAPERFVGELSL